MQKEVIIIGGGLAGTLLALELKTLGFEDFVLLEAGEHLGGNKTWSCFTSDISASRLPSYMLRAQFNTHTVQFPKYHRALASPYLTFGSEKLHQHATTLLSAEQIRLQTHVSGVWQSEVSLENGESLWGNLIVDTRPRPLDDWQPCGFQKFVGWEVEFSQPHGFERPVVMDATVEQRDGYRFFYLLPLTDRMLLCEDTRYSNSPAIDQSEFRGEIRRYLQRKFQGAYRIVREEQGILPVPLSNRYVEHQLSIDQALQFGTRAGFFHPVTSYSLPYALRLSRELAVAIASRAIGPPELASYLKAQLRNESSNRRFYLGLNRMLFLAAEPQERLKIFERFYQLPESIIQRFYSGRTTLTDAGRILLGRPPVPMFEALRALWSSPPSQISGPL